MFFHKYITQGVRHCMMEIGANDPEHISNSNELITKCGWNAILIEPCPPQAEKLRNYYKENLKVIVIEAAISDQDGDGLLHKHGEANTYNQMFHVCASLIPNGHGCGAWEVKTLSGKTLCNIIDFSQVGVLSVDTEGYDYKVISSLFEASLHRPELIITENVSTWFPNEELLKVGLLEAEGYKLLEIEDANSVYLLE